MNQCTKLIQKLGNMTKSYKIVTLNLKSNNYFGGNREKTNIDFEF